MDKQHAVINYEASADEHKVKDLGSLNGVRTRTENTHRRRDVRREVEGLEAEGGTGGGEMEGEKRRERKGSPDGWQTGTDKGSGRWGAKSLRGK